MSYFLFSSTNLKVGGILVLRFLEGLVGQIRPALHEIHDAQVAAGHRITKECNGAYERMLSQSHILMVESKHSQDIPQSMILGL